LKAAFAFVSGSSIPEMLHNADRRHRIYESKNFIMPIARIADLGGSSPVTIPGSDGPSSCVRVTSYQLFTEPLPGNTQTPVTTSGLSANIGGLTAGQSYFFAVTQSTTRQSQRSVRRADQLTRSPLGVE